MPAVPPPPPSDTVRGASPRGQGAAKGRPFGGPTPGEGRRAVHGRPGGARRRRDLLRRRALPWLGQRADRGRGGRPTAAHSVLGGHRPAGAAAARLALSARWRGRRGDGLDPWRPGPPPPAGLGRGAARRHPRNPGARGQRDVRELRRGRRSGAGHHRRRPLRAPSGRRDSRSRAHPHDPRLRRPCGAVRADRLAPAGRAGRDDLPPARRKRGEGGAGGGARGRTRRGARDA